MSNGQPQAHAWADLPSALEASLSKATKAAASDEQLKAFTTSDAITDSATFGIKAAGSDETLLVTVNNGKIALHKGTAKDALFVLSALPQQWEQFFQQTPVSPYQSYWGSSFSLRSQKRLCANKSRHVWDEHQAGRY